MSSVGFYRHRELRHFGEAPYRGDMGISEIIMAVAAVAAAAGTAVSAVNSSDNANAQAKAQEYNAQAARQNAKNAILQASAQEEQVRRENAYKLGELQGSLLESGIGTGGSAISVLTSSAKNTEMDALNTRYRGALEANSLLSGAQMDTFSAEVSRNNASSALVAGGMSSASSLLSGASQVYSGTLSSSNTPHFSLRYGMKRG